jgi:signal transduction histidine kinase/ActR/RegA family two-component response regulator
VTDNLDIDIQAANAQSRPCEPSADMSPADVTRLEVQARVARNQLDLLYELTPRPVLAGMVFSLLMGILLWPALGGAAFASWVGSRWFICLVRLWDCHDYTARPPAASDVASRRRRFLALMVFECLNWTALGVVFAHRASPQVGMLLLAILVGVVAVAMFALASDARASSAFISIVMLPIAVAEIVAGTPQSVTLGLGAGTLLVLLIIESRGLEGRMVELLRLRHENAAIAEQRQRALVLAEHASKAKSRFLATVSHEMRTPLNGILGMTQLLQRHAVEQGRRDRLDVIAQSARHLQTVIGDLLDLSRIESGHLGVDPAPLRLVASLREVVDLLSPMATAKGLRLDVEIEPDLPEWILGDAPRIKQVLLNLLGNAIKFTAVGVVELRARASGALLILEVTDSGIGVPDDQRERIFEAFEQLPSDGAQHLRSGTGLGLTISRELARAMGGDVVCDAAPGGGSRFCFTLPCRASHAGEPRVAADTPARRIEGRVLIVEDNPVNALIARSMLEELGAEVDLAEDGQMALDQMQQARYRAVLMDCQMPVLDGWQATRLWREREGAAGAARTPIIALTANAVAGDRERCLAAGMDDYLPKPFEMAALSVLLERHVGSAGLADRT